MWKFLALVQLIIVSFYVEESLAQCPDSSPPIPPSQLPQLPNRFQTRVHVTSTRDRKFKELTIHYDYDMRKATLQIVESNTSRTFYYNYDTNEILEVAAPVMPLDSIHSPPDDRPLYPSKCKAFKLDDQQSASLDNFGFLDGFDGNVITAAQILRFTPQKRDGTDIIRGIKVEKYVSCQYNAKLKANFTAEHYFSNGQDLIGTNDNYNKLPVQTIYSGTLIQPDGSVRTFNYVYEYHDFRLYFSRPNVFQTPSVVYCEGRKESKPPVQVKFPIRFSAEIVYSEGTVEGTDFKKTTVIRDIHLSKDFTTFTFRNPYTDDFSFNASEPVRYVRDRSLKVEYGINQVHGNCVVRPYKSYTYNPNDETKTFSAPLHFISQLEQNDGILNTLASYVFTGKRNANGIMGDRYVALISGDTHEFVFTQENWTIHNELQDETNVPITLNVDSPVNERLTYRVSFFDFDTNDHDQTTYDIKSCFRRRDVIEFEIAFRYKDIVTQDQLAYQKNLDEKLLEIFYEQTFSLPIRFSLPKIAISNNGYMYARSTIYPPPPPLVYFKFIGNFYVTGSSDYSNFTFNNVTQCAEYCLTKADCRSFDSSAFGSCYLYKKTVSEGLSTSNSSNYQHFERTMLSDFALKDVEQLYSTLSLLAVSAEIKLPLEITDSGQSQMREIPSEKFYQVTNTFNRFGTTQLLSRFDIVMPNTRMNKVIGDEYDRITIDDCAQKCVDKIGNECKSFHYCYLSGDCLISDQPYTPVEDLLDDNCDIYEKDPLSHYIRFPIRSKVDPKDVKYQNVENTKECAMKCDAEKKLQCKSFNFCPAAKVCYLSENHLLDPSEGDSEDLTCDHYSRNYIQDFTYVATSTLRLDAEVVLKETDLNRCSVTCVTSRGFNCKSFDYCPESKTCLLNSGDSQISTSNLQAPTDKCGHYRRDYYYETSQNANLNKKEGSDVVLIVLSVLFSVGSLVGGIVGTIFLFRKYSLVKQ